MRKVLLILAMLVLGMTFSMNAKGNDRTNTSKEIYERDGEEIFLSVIRSELEHEGYHSCGITLSSITRMNENKEYTVNIHHHLISELTEEEQDMLLSRLENIYYPYEDCKVIYKIVK